MVKYTKRRNLRNYNLYLLCLIICYCSNQAKAQDPFYFAYDFDYHQQSADKVLAIDSIIYTSGISLPKGVINNERSFYLAQFSGSGKYITHRTYEDEDLADAFSNLCRFLVPIDNEIYTANSNIRGGSESTSYNQITSYNVVEDSFRVVYRLDPIPPSLLSDRISTLFLATNNMIGFTISPRGENTRALVLQIIDPHEPSELIGEFRHEVLNHEFFTWETFTDDSHYYCLGYIRENNPVRNKLFCAKITHELELVELRIYDDLVYGGSQFAAHTNDNENFYIAAQHRVDDNTTFGTSYPVFLKLNAELDIVWQQQLVDTNLDKETTIFYDTKASHSQDSSILVGTGSKGNETFPLIAKIGTKGDSIFYYRLENLDGYFYGSLRNMDLTSDGNYIASGFVGAFIPENEIFTEVY